MSPPFRTPVALDEFEDRDDVGPYMCWSIRDADGKLVPGIDVIPTDSNVPGMKASLEAIVEALNARWG